MIDQPETQGSTAPAPQEKLILPAYDDGHALRSSGSLPQVHIRPEQLIRHTTMPPKAPLARLRYFWLKDPAYKVLMIAIGTVVVAGLVFASLLSNTLLRNPNLFAVNNTFSQNAPGALVPGGTVDLRPTFAPPGGGKGTNTSSQPPVQSTPATGDSNATAQPDLSPTPGGSGTLSVQITNIPTRVINNSVVNVGVNTSEANVTVTLYVLYSAPPFRDSAGPRLTDGSGNASIPWSVSVNKLGGARAMVFALARDTSGQRAESQPVTVQIAGFGG